MRPIGTEFGRYVYDTSTPLALFENRCHPSVGPRWSVYSHAPRLPPHRIVAINSCAWGGGGLRLRRVTSRVRFTAICMLLDDAVLACSMPKQSFRVLIEKMLVHVVDRMRLDQFPRLVRNGSGQGCVCQLVCQGCGPWRALCRHIGCTSEEARQHLLHNLQGHL